MFPPMPAQASKEERQLIKAFKRLNDADKASCIAFAEFLQSRPQQGEVQVQKVVISEPLDIPRPDEESVIKAIKRLTKTYPMVDKETILHPISDLMTSHMIQGRVAKDVIDDFEVLFKKSYESLLDKNNSQKGND